MAYKHVKPQPHAEFRHRAQIPMPAVAEVEQRQADLLSPSLLAPRQLVHSRRRGLYPSEGVTGKRLSNEEAAESVASTVGYASGTPFLAARTFRIRSDL